MKLVQFLIVGAVGVANAYWQWTPNSYVATGMGIGLAYCFTVLWVKSIDAYQRFRVGLSSSIRPRTQ